MSFIRFPSETRAIIFDFDGVVLNSVPLKTNAFRMLFSDYPSSQVEKLVAFHIANGGVSRFQKIKYFFNSLLKQPISDSEVEEWAELFSEMTLSELSKPEYRIQEVFAFIEGMSGVYDMYVASGAAEKDLFFLCQAHGITDCFKQILGSPTEKEKNVQKILHESRFAKQQFVMIGDSTTDRDAADSSGIRFYFYNNTKFQKSKNYLHSFYS